VERLADLAEVKAYGSGNVIMDLDRVRSRVCIIARGAARLYCVSRDGRERNLATFGAGGFFGLGLTPAAVPAALLQATADGTVACDIPSRCVYETMKAEPEVAARVVGIFGEQLVEMTSRYAELALHDVQTRLAHRLAELASDDAEGRVLATHEAIAHDIGTRPDEVSKAIRRLREEGLIASKHHRHGIRVLEAERLRNYRETRMQ
jgi:CRP/FNR family transcriptional regulator